MSIEAGHIHSESSSLRTRRLLRALTFGTGVTLLTIAGGYALTNSQAERQRVISANSEPQTSGLTPSVFIEPLAPLVAAPSAKVSEANDHVRWGIIDEEIPAKPTPISVSGSDILTPPPPDTNILGAPVLSQGDLMVSEGIIKP